MFAGVTLGGLGTAFGAFVGSLIVGHHHPGVDPLDLARAQERQRPDPADPDPRGAAPGHLRATRADRLRGDTWTGEHLENALRAGVSREAAVFAIAAMGLNIHFGYTGLLNFGQVGFMAIGRLRRRHRHHLLRLAPCRRPHRRASSAAWSWPCCSACPTLRLRADYLAIVTIAAAEIIRTGLPLGVAARLLRGSNGINGFASGFYTSTRSTHSSRVRLRPVPVLRRPALGHPRRLGHRRARHPDHLRPHAGPVGPGRCARSGRTRTPPGRWARTSTATRCRASSSAASWAASAGMVLAHRLPDRCSPTPTRRRSPSSSTPC